MYFNVILTHVYFRAVKRSIFIAEPEFDGTPQTRERNYSLPSGSIRKEIQIFEEQVSRFRLE